MLGLSKTAYAQVWNSSKSSGMGRTPQLIKGDDVWVIEQVDSTGDIY